MGAVITNFARISEEELAKQAFLEKRQMLINIFLDITKGNTLFTHLCGLYC